MSAGRAVLGLRAHFTGCIQAHREQEATACSCSGNLPGARPNSLFFTPHQPFPSHRSQGSTELRGSGAHCVLGRTSEVPLSPALSVHRSLTTLKPGPGSVSPPGPGSASSHKSFHSRQSPDKADSKETGTGNPRFTRAEPTPEGAHQTDHERVENSLPTPSPAGALLSPLGKAALSAGLAGARPSFRPGLSPFASQCQAQGLAQGNPWKRNEEGGREG